MDDCGAGHRPLGDAGAKRRAAPWLPAVVQSARVAQNDGTAVPGHPTRGCAARRRRARRRRQGHGGAFCRRHWACQGRHHSADVPARRAGCGCTVPGGNPAWAQFLRVCARGRDCSRANRGSGASHRGPGRWRRVRGGRRRERRQVHFCRRGADRRARGSLGPVRDEHP
eukprot:Amastigsp_a511965_34.p2 type:complete len:169 gc:universal Amastigsp_a511965_34:630-124(-)